MKYKSKRSKACDIPEAVRQAVFDRDHGKCVICAREGIPNAHVIPRSKGGLGIEQNIVTLCPKCHHEYDNGQTRDSIGELITEYMRQHYKGWDDYELIYNKWKDFKIK